MPYFEGIKPPPKPPTTKQDIEVFLKNGKKHICKNVIDLKINADNIMVKCDKELFVFFKDELVGYRLFNLRG
jgi:hypothetical protein